MAYPQPNSDQYALNGYTYFRLNTPLSSPGDIYESAQGAQAFAIGPDSDVDRVNIAYFDDQRGPTFVNRATIGPSRSLVGVVAARNEVQYMPGARPGRILIWPEVLYDPSFKPPLWTDGPFGFDTLRIIPPQLDVIQYFTPVPSLSTGRSDRTYLFQTLEAPVQPNAQGNLMIPYYGRRYACIEVTNRTDLSTSTSIDLAIYGVNFTYSVASPASQQTHQITTIRALTPLAANAQTIEIITAENDGMFDYLLIQTQRVAPGLLPGDPCPAKITVSDCAR